MYVKIYKFEKSVNFNVSSITDFLGSKRRQNGILIAL